MEYKTLRGVTLPVLGIGSWKGRWGERERPPYDPQRDVVTTLAIQCAIRNGITHIDTAELYGEGYAEEQIGKAITGIDRSLLFITSKVSGNHLDYNSIMSAIDGSLQRLGTNYLDLYLVHWPSDVVPISETMAAMGELVSQGKVKHIGFSNFSLSQIVEAQKYTTHRISAVQVEYNLERRDDGRHSLGVESEVIPYCQENGIFVIAYKPFAEGKFAKRGQTFLDELADKYQKTPAQVTLNWLLSKQNIVTIPGTTNTEHITENLGAIGWEMEAADLLLLDQFRI